MANGLYALGAQAILSGSIAFATDTIKMALVSSSYTPNRLTDQFWSAVSANALGTPIALTSVSVANGVLAAAAATIAAASSGTGAYVVLYKDTGTSSTSPLLAIFDTLPGLPYSASGGPFTALWTGGQIIALYP